MLSNLGLELAFILNAEWAFKKMPASVSVVIGLIYQWKMENVMCNYYSMGQLPHLFLFAVLFYTKWYLIYMFFMFTYINVFPVSFPSKLESTPFLLLGTNHFSLNITKPSQVILILTRLFINRAPSSLSFKSYLYLYLLSILTF